MKKTLIASAVLMGIGGAINQASGEVVIQPDGIGDKFFVPYYSTKHGNVTIFSMTNTAEDAKVMKVRFREAMGSEDAADFQVWLSPGDVWNALVSQGSEGPEVNFNDTSCTTPAVSTFNLLDERIPDIFTGDAGERIKEGYIEIFEMASFEDGYVLYNDVLHNQNVNPPTPPCALAPFRGANDAVAPMDSSSGTDSDGYRYDAPTGGVYSYAILLNVPGAEAMGYEAVAMQNVNAALAPRYFPQVLTDLDVVIANAGLLDNDLVSAATERTYSLDEKVAAGILWSRTNGAFIQAQSFDVPDMSTPFEQSDNAGSQFAAPFALDTPSEQILGNGPNAGISDVINAQNLMNDFATESNVNGATDFIVNMPTKRYHVMGRAGSTHTSGAPILPPFAASFNEFDGQACETIIVQYYNREESFDQPEPDEIVQSPKPPVPPTQVQFCGEANVLGFNSSSENGDQSDAVEAEQAFFSIDTIVEINGNPELAETGWANIDLTNGNNRSGLPVAGFAALTATSFAPAAGTQANFGAAVDHKFSRNFGRIMLAPGIQ